MYLILPVLGLFGLSALFRKRPIPSPVGRSRATLAPPLLLVLGLAGIVVAKANAGTLHGPR